MLATRLPRRSTEWSQRAEWNAGPAKDESPGKSGILGSTSGPVPETSTRARTWPRDVSRTQRRASTSHEALVTSQFSRTRGITSAATRSR